MPESQRPTVSNARHDPPGARHVAWTGSCTTIVLAWENEGQLAEAGKKRTETQKLEQRGSD
jgi:hypothetical protein